MPLPSPSRPAVIRRLPRLAAAAALFALVAAACGTGDTGSAQRGEATVRRPPAAAAEAVADARTDLAARLYLAVADQRGDDLAVSPLLVTDGLAMVRAGAVEDTAAELDAVLGTGDIGPTELLDGVAAAESAVLADTGEQTTENRRGTVSVRSASSLWLQRGTVVDEAYLDELAAGLDRGVRLVDFRSDADSAGDAVNRWAEQETGGQIRVLAPRGTMGSSTRMALASALTYEAPWAVPFDVTRTTVGDFTRADGTTTRVPLLRRDAAEGLRLAEGDGWQAVEVPYLGGQLTMVLLVPSGPDLGPVHQLLAAGGLGEALDGLRRRPVALTLPRFAFTTELDLVAPLTGMGLVRTTDVDEAQLDAMAPAESLALGEVVQQTFVAVDEEGSSQSAATVSARATTPTDLTPVVADHPFVFVVRHPDSGSVLLIGRVTDP